MKTSAILAILILFFSITSAGQSLIGKGTYSINGTVSFISYYNENSDFNSSVFIFSPGFDYFIIDNLSLGIKLSIQNETYGGTSNLNWGIGPSARYYLTDKIFKPFLLVSYSYAQQNTSLSGEDIKLSNIAFGLGGDYFLSDNVALETLVSYTFTNTIFPERLHPYYNDSEMKTLSIGIGVNVFLR